MADCWYPLVRLVTVLYSCNTTVHIHNTYTNISGNISTIMTTLMNERTHFFIKIYLSHFIWKGWCWLCVRGELETGTNCYILTQSPSDYSSTSFASWLGCLTVGHWGPQALSLQADSHAGILFPNWLQLELELNWPKPFVAPGYIFVWHPPASCGHTHLHRIQPHPLVKVIFQYEN